MPTFKHLTSGSTFISSKGAVYRFLGAQNAVGIVEVTNEDDVAALRELCKNPQVPIEEVVEASAVSTPLEKQPDPAVAIPVQEVRDQAAKDSVIEALQANIGNVLKSV